MIRDDCCGFTPTQRVYALQFELLRLQARGVERRMKLVILRWRGEGLVEITQCCRSERV